MTDDLRLRTILALGARWDVRPNFLLFPNGSGFDFIARRHEDGSIEWYADEAERAYGTTWASCGEIDTAIKERGWQWESQIIRDEIGVMIYKGLLNATIATAPAIPAAICLAFCRAVEASRA